MKHGPIFIIGSPRSGTTLLRTTLSSHSQISIPHEFPLFSLLYERYEGESDIDMLIDYLFSFTAFKEWGINRTKLRRDLKDSDQRLSVIISNIYINYIEENYKGKTIWGDKNIGHTAYLKEIKREFPEAKFVHIVRDVRSVALSLKTRKWLSYRFARKPRRYIRHIKGGVKTWLDALCLISEFKSECPEALYEMRYEDLVSQPEQQLKKLSSFLDISFEQKMLEHSTEAKRTISPEKISANHENIMSKILASKVENYKQELTDNQQNNIIYLAKDQLLKYEYSIENFIEPTFFQRLIYDVNYVVVSFKYFLLTRVYFLYKMLRA